MNIVSEIIAQRRQEFESRMRQAAQNAQNGIFQQNLDSSTSTSSTSSSSETTLSDVDNQYADIAKKQSEATKKKNSTTDKTDTTSYDNSTQKEGSGSDKWNINDRYHVTGIRSANKNKYVDIITEMSKKYGLPVNLIQRVIEVESDFNNNDSSSAGAQGLMQLMPGTAKGYGVTDPYDPRQNIEAGVKMLSQNLKKYNGNLVLSLAAYNAGSGNVHKYGGVPPFKETINYIKKITGISV